MKSIRRIGRVLLAASTLALMAGFRSAAFAQAPAAVPALPDSERRTSYSVTGSTCACSVGFALYGDSTDYQNWVEVYLNGVRINYNDSVKGWTITSPTGPLATIPRPVTDAVLTFNSTQTGTVQIVGARRPRRTILFQENRGVAARDLNQGFNDIFSQNRETWDKINDVTGRGLFSQPGNTIGPLPPPASCVANYLGFDATGLNPVCLSTTTGVANFNSPPPIGNVIPNTGAFTAVNVAYQNTFAPGVRAPVFIWSNCDNTTAAGQDCNFQAWTGNNPTATPDAANPVTATFVMVNGNNRGAGPHPIEVMNIVGVQCGTAEGCTTGYVDSPMNGLEIDLTTSASFSTRNRAWNSTSGSYNRLGEYIANSPGVAQLTSAYASWGANATLAATFYEGVALASISDIGVHFVANPLGRTDLFTAFSVCGICDDSNSTSFVKFGNFTHAGPMIDAGSGATFLAFYKGSTIANTNVLFYNGANFTNLMSIDSGNTTAQLSAINFNDRGAAMWQVGKIGANTFNILNFTSGNYSMIIAASDAVTFKNSITFGSASLPATTVSFTNDAAAQTATITNGPVAGNPKKWIPINDNGTTLDIPAWCHTGGC